MRRIVLLRVGIDTGSGGIHGPLFADHGFELVPIPGDLHGSDDRTYGNTSGRFGRRFVEYFPRSRQSRMATVRMHVDPEFDTFTYGDPNAPKRGLRRLEPGDIVAFHAGLEGWGGHTSEPACHLIGYFEVSHAGMATEFSDSEINALFAHNAHVRDAVRFREQRERLVLLKGGPGSRLLTKAVRISEMGADSRGSLLKVLSKEMRAVFGELGGKGSVQRSNPRWVDDAHADEAAAFLRGL